MIYVLRRVDVFAVRLETVKPGRVVDEDLLARRRVGRPDCELVQQASIVDLVKLQHVGRLADGACIRVRPIGAPNDAIRIGGDKRLGERYYIGIVRGLRRRSIGAGDLDIRFAGPDEIEKISEPRLLKPQRGLAAAGMI